MTVFASFGFSEAVPQEVHGQTVDVDLAVALMPPKGNTDWALGKLFCF
jgi:hypothetical protein